jgi:hypothetical protein
MNSLDYKDLERALSLLHDFIENFSGELSKPDDLRVLTNAEDVLRGYVSCGGEQAPPTVTEKLKEFFETQDPSKLMEALRCS